MERQRRLDGGFYDAARREEGTKCCLCNGVNQQFVDENGLSVQNPRQPSFAGASGGGDSGGADENSSSSGSPRRRNFFDLFRGWGSSQAERGSTTGNTEQRQQQQHERDGERARSFLENLQRQGESIFGGLDPRAFGEQFERDWGASGTSGNSNRPSGFNANALLDSLSRSLGVDPNVILEQFSGENNGSRTSPASPTGNNANHSEFNTFRNGTPVVLQNLENSSHLNGERGKILRYLHTTGTYYVQLESNPRSPIAVRQDKILQRITIRIIGITSQPNLNGKAAIICSYSRERNRYCVRLTRLSSIGTSSREISIQPANMLIPDGTIVRLEGLERQTQWNGKWGTIVHCNVGGRYQVRLSRMYSVRVKMENVRL